MQIQKEFTDKRALFCLMGPNNSHLKEIETEMDVRITADGNCLTIEGSSRDVPMVDEILNQLYERCIKAGDISVEDISRAILLAHGGERISPQNSEDLVLKTRKRHINPRTQNQADFVQAMKKSEMVFGLGPAGTGKTFLAVAYAVSAMLEGKCEKIILTRPAVEAGENLGFLPGDLKEKIDPYLRPLYDALYEMLPADQVDKKLSLGEIEVAPLAYMRGRTLAHSVIILDEAQNTTAMQMKMFLTRLGEGSRMIINGDLSQTDLPRGVTSGLSDAIEVVKNVEGVKIVEFSEKDVVRHGLVSKIVKAYDNRQKND